MGLQIIDVHAGAYDELSKLTKHVESPSKFPYPVVHDADNLINEVYDIASYPAAYLIGSDGKVVWEGVPDANNAEQMKALEARVAAELKKISPRMLARRDGGIAWMSGESAAIKGVREKKRILLYKDWPR